MTTADDRNETLAPASNDAVDSALSVSRRALLRGATAVVPTILTLHSGAALAQTSNLVSTAPGTTPIADGKYQCLDTSSVYKTDRPNTYDLGSPPLGRVTRISADGRYYRIRSNGQPSNDAVSGPTMCNEGGEFYRKDNGWTQVRVEQGVLVSGTALASFSSSIRYTDV